MHWKPIQIAILVSLVASMVGCSEGIFWRTGEYAPWVRKQWEEEEKIATTLSTRKSQMDSAVEAALVNGSSTSKDEIAAKLQDVIYRDPVILLRLHAVDLLGKLDCDTAFEALRSATKDGNDQIRIAAVNAMANQSSGEAVFVLQEVLGSDLNVDVRVAATRSLGKLNNPRSVQALSLALEDSNPALQVVATESLENLTGKDFGPDVVAWKQYVDSTGGSSTRSADRSANEDSNIR